MEETIDHWQPTLYECHSDFQYQSTGKLLSTIDFPEQGKVLDIGCGDGRITSAIATAHPHLTITGIDSSPSMIAAATDRYRNIDNLNFVVQDAHYLALDEKFDTIISFWTLGWLIDHGLFLKSCYQCLNKAGNIYLFAVENHPMLKQAVDDATADQQWDAYFTGKTFHENYGSLMLYKELIAFHQLEGLGVNKHTVDYAFPSAEALHGFISGWLQQLSVLPDKEQSTFVSAIVSNYQSLRKYSGANPLSIDCAGFIVQGIKGGSIKTEIQCALYFFSNSVRMRDWWPQNTLTLVVLPAAPLPF